MIDYSKDTLRDSVIKFVLKLNSLYNNHVFTSSRIAKEIMKDKEFKKTLFPKVHKELRLLLKDWSKEGICTFIYNSKLGRSRRTKAIYQFTKSGITKLKKLILFDTADKIRLNKKDRLRFFLPRKQLTRIIQERNLLI
jgi:hypothetical protein